MELEKYIEHTLLKQDATKDELIKLFNEVKNIILKVFVLTGVMLHWQKNI